MRLGYASFLMIGLLVACTPAATPEPSPTPTDTPRTSTWGTIEQVAQAEQGAGPVLFALDDNLFFAWTGAEENEARLYGWRPGGTAHILALKAYYPFDVSLFDAGRSRLMLWLDRAETSPDLNLLTGIVSVDAVAEFGPYPVSNLPTRRYSAVQLPGGLVRVVFSSGMGLQSSLYLNHVDRGARAQSPQGLRPNADYPALVLDSGGTVHLYWLENEGQDVYSARFDESSTPPTLIAINHLTSTPISVGDAIADFNVAFDETHAYLFWTVQHMDGRQEVRIASGAIGATSYPPPRPFGILPSSDTAIQTTFNSGYVYTASETNAVAVSWANPLTGQHSILPVAVNQGTQLGVAYFRDGTLMGYQDVVESGALIGIPAIATERNRHLYLTWAEPTLEGYANLYLTTTRR